MNINKKKKEDDDEEKKKKELLEREMKRHIANEDGELPLIF